MDSKIKQTTLRMISNGMYIMTSRSGDNYGGATITWLSQASFKPPLIMAALRRDSNVFQCLSESRFAAIHILGAGQQEVARRFFKPTEVAAGAMNGEPFKEGKTLAPILENLPAYVECQLQHIIDDGGDHALAVMEVVEAECRDHVKPLTIADTPWEYGG